MSNDDAEHSFSRDPKGSVPPGEGASPGAPAPALSKAYDPAAVELRLYGEWEQAGCFRPEAGAPGKPFTIVIPPPNVTDRLHLGHALNTTLQDILIRWRRMQGRKTLWLPGTDHAGIATQAVVERRIFQKEKKTRHDLGRDEVVRRIWAWRKECGDIILRQLRRIGSSCDWTRTRFTLDETCARAVRHAFFRMFKDGLIYRGKRLVNWDTHLQTAVSDDEVYHEKVKGHLWHICYPVKGQPGRFMTPATTRPETMLGDTAVAVHPDDPRYKDLVGRTVILPLLGREIPVIADGKLVDPKFGSGCVKVTPAHDPNDYEVGLRHNLEMINILTPDGHINENGGPYQGLGRFAARDKVVEDLQAQGLVEKIEPYETEIGHSDRSKTPIEPYLSDQWFVRMADLAGLAMEAVRDGRVTFHPDRYARTFLDWLSQKRDWCISRQLWWGHQIPVWKGKPEDYTTFPEFLGKGRRKEGDSRTFLPIMIDGVDCAYQMRTEDGVDFVYISVPEGHPETERDLESHGFVRDPDVLDTWFSSALWPFSTLGWPEPSADLKAFYPTDVLVTAREIITLWVARMVMMGLYNVGDVPFRDVYIHAMIQDGEGRPMKKSLGNGVDPLEIVSSHGADALRFTLAWMTTETQDVRMPVVKDPATGHNTSPRFDMGRNFCNKLWNAVRFAIMNLEGADAAKFDPAALRLEDRWILSRTEQARRAATEALEAFQFQAAISALYTFFWDELCDWYLEAVKPRMADPAGRPTAQRVLAFVVDRALRLLHPFIPFITEAAWEGLGATVRNRDLPGLADAPTSVRLIMARWPEPADRLIDEEAEREFGLRREIILAVRKAKAESGQSASQVEVYVPDPAGREELIAATFRDYGLLAAVREVHIGRAPPAGQVAAGEFVPALGSSVYVPMPEEMVKRERARLEKDIADKERLLAGIEGKLANKQFTDRAPADVVQRERARAEEARMAIAALQKRRTELG
ncbi:MAG: valine--tRNA ligase [Planctomycetota bacterium]|nr:valine--tRNA ligase [Planctomycetota bacterium]